MRKVKCNLHIHVHFYLCPLSRHHNIVKKDLDDIDNPEDIMLTLYINVIMPIRSGKLKKASIKNTIFTYLGAKG